MKEFFKKLFEKIKVWFNKTALPWLKSSWMQIVNIIIMFIAYGSLDSAPGSQAIVGFWLFILLGYYIFWKLLGAEFIFKKSEPMVDIAPNKSSENLQPGMGAAKPPKTIKNN